MSVFAQRHLIFPVPPLRLDPERAGASAFRSERFTSFDGTRVEVWRSGGGEGPVALLFHGNGQINATNLERMELARRLGYRVVAMEYRGYNGNAGRPAEAALVGDGEALLERLRAEGVQPGDVVVWGYSIGAAVAAQLGARHGFGALVLEAPFLSLRRLAAELYPGAPVRWLLLDPFLSSEAAPLIASPTLVVAGERDGIVPPAHGRALAALIPGAAFVEVPQAGHADILRFPDGLRAVEGFLAARRPASTPP